MERLKLFRFSSFLFFVGKVSRAEGVTDVIARQVNTMLEELPGTKPLVERIIKMDSTQRMHALSQLMNLLTIFAVGTRQVTNQEWVSKIDRVFEHYDDDDSDTDSDKDSANSIYELLVVKIPGGGELDFLGTVIQGCSLVSLDGLCLLNEIPVWASEQIRKRTIDTGNFWRVKCPFGRGVELFLDCREASLYCRTYCLSPKGQSIIHWLDQQPIKPTIDSAYRHRFQILEAVDSTEYVITFLGSVPTAGHLVLIRASDGYVHLASFMKACVGLPLTELEVWDDHCVRLSDVMKGPVKMRLDPPQIETLTIPLPPPPPVIVVD